LDLATLNLYLDGFLSLPRKVDDSLDLQRKTLIEEAAFSENLLDLLEEWLWLYEMGADRALRLKLWFRLSDRQLAELFHLGSLDISQVLRNERSALLPHYHPSDQSGAPVGFSCFMVDQHLSTWIDSEISDLRTLAVMDEHLGKCPDCHSRLQAHRKLHAEILQQKLSFRAVDEDEWLSTLNAYRSRVRRRWSRLFVYMIVFASVLGSFGWFLWSKPEKMPNIYEIREP